MAPIPVASASRSEALPIQAVQRRLACSAGGRPAVVSPFPDPIGRDVIIQWLGGVNMQLYWHTTPPRFGPLVSVPENRIYVSKDRADAFIRGFVAFSHGAVTSDDAAAPEVEIGARAMLTDASASNPHSGCWRCWSPMAICPGPTDGN